MIRKGLTFQWANVTGYESHPPVRRISSPKSGNFPELTYIQSNSYLYSCSFQIHQIQPKPNWSILVSSSDTITAIAQWPQPAQLVCEKPCIILGARLHRTYMPRKTWPGTCRHVSKSGLAELRDGKIRNKECKYLDSSSNVGFGSLCYPVCFFGSEFANSGISLESFLGSVNSHWRDDSDLVTTFKNYVVLGF